MFPLFADDHHRRDHDLLIEKLWRVRIWMRAQARKREQARLDVCPFPDYVPHWLRQAE